MTLGRNLVAGAGKLEPTHQGACVRWELLPICLKSLRGHRGTSDLPRFDKQQLCRELSYARSTATSIYRSLSPH